MLRPLIVISVFTCLLGCRSQYGCGTRVPPPATGAYGVPNTYYPAAGPRASLSSDGSADSIAGSWRNVSGEVVNLETPSGNLTPVTSIPSSALPPTNSPPAATSSPAPIPRIRQASTAQASSAQASAGQVQLNGMRVNEIRPVAPASFEAAVDRDRDAEAPVGTGVRPSAANPTVPTINSLRNSSAAAAPTGWQSRPTPTPAPNRFAGN